MLTIEDIRSPKNASGFSQVGRAGGRGQGKVTGKPWCAYAGRGRRGDWKGPRRATPEEAAQDYCDRINGSALTIEDIRNPARKSGFDHVGTTGLPGPNGNPAGPNARPKWRASLNGGGRPNGWRGPRRATAEEAAQDYCDYINGQRSATVPRLNNAAHPSRPSTPRNEEIEAALGVLRDHRAQRAGRPGYVYLIVEVRPGGGLRYGKIGYSTNPLARVGELQAGNPNRLQLHAAKPGTEADERALHERYIDHNVLGEWFLITRELLLEFPRELPEEIAT